MDRERNLCFTSTNNVTSTNSVLFQKREDGMSLSQLDYTVSVVTGAGRGIGKGIADELARQGSHVFVADRDAARAAGTAGEIARAGGRATAVTFDLGLEGECAHLLSEVLSTGGRVDVLVNNASTWSGRPYADVCPTGPARSIWADWERVFRVNLAGTMHLSRDVADAMCANAPNACGIRGRIIQITSVHDTIVRRFHAEYPMSKAGQLSLVKELALSYGPKGIRVNGVAPGRIDTDDVVVQRGERKADRYTPLLWRAGLPQDVATVVAFLANDARSYFIHGEVIRVSGGLHLWNHFCEEIPPEGRP